MTIYRSQEKSYGHYGYRSYHIEGREISGTWQQRHIWTLDDGSIEIEEWIASRDWFRNSSHYQAVAA